MDLLLTHNDLAIERGDIALCPTDTACLAQTITTRLKTMQGEWFLDETLGIPYFTAIFGHARSSHFIRELVVAELKSIPGIKDITDFKATTSSARVLTISFQTVFANGFTQSFKESVGVNP